MPSAKLRFGDVLHAIGGTSKALEQWRDKGLVKPEVRSADGWTTYTFKDVAILSVTRALVDFGVGVVEAFKIARHAVQLGLKDVQDKTFSGDGEEFFAGWKDRIMTVQRDRKDPKKWHIGRWEQDRPFGNFILIDVHTVVKEAIERASDRLAAKLEEPPAKKTG